MSRLRSVLRMIKFEHSVFALPFAFAGAWIAASGVPPWADLVGIVVAAVAARSAAMAFNRLVDLRFDATNPRTKQRELVTGVLTPAWTAGFTLVCSALFVGASFWLAPICGWLSLPVLVVLLGYSFLKRFTALTHFGLGVALGCAPCGAWLAVSKGFVPGWEVPLVLGLGVVAWVAGFDLLYSLQDVEHDQMEGLFSIPSRWGPGAARWLARGLHVLALAAFAVVGQRAGYAALYYAGLAVVAALLCAEHWLVRGGRRESIPLAFFNVNAWVGVAFFAGLLAEIHLAA